jgi:hypothetical protein
VRLDNYPAQSGSFLFQWFPLPVGSYFLAALSEQGPDDEKNDNGPETATSQFKSTVT